MKKKTLGHIYALFTILVWGSCFVLTKVMLTAYTPTQIIPLRMGLAYLTLWALRPKTMKLPWKDELMFILIGITGGSFYFFLQNTASAHTSAANVSILVSMSPILTVILAQLFSRRSEGRKAGKAGIHRRGGGHCRCGAGGAQRHPVLPPEPSGGPAGPGRRPDVGGILHPGEAVYRAV